MTDTFRGHPIHLSDDGEWIYSDTGESTVDNWKDRPCGHCGLSFTEEGHDGCLGTLPDVKNACCGHGERQEAYVEFEGGTRLSDEEAIQFFKEHGVGPY